METEDSIKSRLEFLPRKVIVTLLMMVSAAYALVLSSSGYAPSVFEFSELAVNGTNARYTFEADVKNQFLFLRSYPESKFNSTVHVELLGDGSLITKSSMTWKCEEVNCESKVLFYEPVLSHDSYEIIVNWEEPAEISLELGYVNKNFTVFQILVKCSFSMLAVLSFLLYSWNMKNIPRSAWSFEGKMILTLACSLIFFNDPFFVLSISFPSILMNAVSMFSISQFIFCLFLAWVLTYLRHLGVSQPLVWNAVFGGLISMTYFLIFGVYLYANSQAKEDPTYNFIDVLGGNLPLKVAIVVLVGINLIILVGLTITGLFTCTRVNTRKQTASIINSVMIMLTFIGVGLWEIEGYFSSPVTIVGYTCAFNFYVILLCFLCAPIRVSFYKQTGSETPVYELGYKEDLEFPKFEDN